MNTARKFTTAGALVLASAATFTAAGPAFAAAPGNDTHAGATVISTGFSDSLDTTRAGTDAEDADLNAGCGAPATDASVWYTLTPPADGGVVVDVSGSDYSAGVIVATGSPGSWALETCGPGAVSFFGAAGTTYTILAFDDQFDGTGNGGTLNMTVADAPPPPSLQVDVDKFAAFDSRSGAAFVNGTLTCTGQADFAGIEVQLAQKVGRVATVRGAGFADAHCNNGETQRWSARITPDSGKFAGGKAASVTFAFACGPFHCAEDYQEHIVQLRGKN